MRTKMLRVTFTLVLLILLAVFFTGCNKKYNTNIFMLPSLPKPIAAEDVLITSIGQSTDAYIIRDIANQMMIHNYFMPQARETDFEGIHTLVLVVGYSPLGMRYHDMSLDEEITRTTKLLEKARQKDVTVITVYIGGKQRRGQETDKLMKLVNPVTDYLIGTKDSDYDGFLSQLAAETHIPISLANGVSEISEPFASAFR